ncbi:MAG: hypothetical protein JOY78_20255 [Pseudonocardia sp.]|nr:hypothetical protein [Pseudonocardia sp.]
MLDAYLHTGAEALDVIAYSMPRGLDVAIDIETPGIDRAFEINCVTAAWTTPADGCTIAVLLDPCRSYQDQLAAADVLLFAGRLILHNAPFDIPALVHHELLSLRNVNKVVDTLLLARLAYPNTFDAQTGRKDLTSLTTRLLGITELADGMARAFRAAGYRTNTAGYEGMDIDSPVYRHGAMADTIATLRLEPILRDACRTLLTDHPFVHYGAQSRAQADELIATQETVHRVMLRRSARGLNVDRDYLHTYAKQVDLQRDRATELLADAGLVGGAGKSVKLVEHLAQRGELPMPWPRTPTGRLRATKDDLATLDHPLAAAQRTLAETDRVMGYLVKVDNQAAVTGRCHPQVGTLGASQTGRMSYSYPELQQFPADARPIIIDDGQGLTSIDWSQIEPVTMALMAKDETFLRPFEAGEDLYAPIQRAAGIDRPLAKVVLLATMYGQGVTSLAASINHTVEGAAQIRRQMLAAMPASARWMTKVAGIAERYGRVITAGGRILPVDAGGVFKAINYVVQGSAYDVLAHTIVQMERARLGDELMLAMHDEVVVSAPVADEVRQIMLTPPEFLVKWAGRTPVLRTDLEHLGHGWAKV